MKIRDASFYQDCMTIEHQGRMELWLRLQRIKREAKAEVERDGGCVAFATRVLRLAGGDNED